MIFAFLTISLAFLHYFYAIKFQLERLELIAIAIFTLWILLIGFIDIKSREIPLWLTAPIIIAGLIFRLFQDNFISENNAVLGLNLHFFDAALGICFGFIIVDMITHFGNWLAKYPSSSQGLLPIWISIIPISLSAFIPVYPLWAIFFALIIFRFLIEYLYSRTTYLKDLIDWLCANALITYIVLFTILFSVAYVFLNNSSISLSVERINLVISILCFNFIIEEILLPVIQFISRKLKNIADIPSEQKEQTVNKDVEDALEKNSVLGGGDATLTAALGAIWGAVVINNCLLLAFVLALIVFGIAKLISFLTKNSDLTSSGLRVPFAPFVTISAQVVLFAEIMLRSSTASSSCVV
ncbi:MAG: prepilin peptidase [Candidatus Caenarcaniphilales bacterium]|nr:prepilin peptidase [Candidatus Caenarcaniphilales bacterium]